MWVHVDKTGLKSKADMARECGVNDATFFGLINYRRLILEPTTKIGLRYYYDDAQQKEIVKTIKELRKTGRLK